MWRTMMEKSLVTEPRDSARSNRWRFGGSLSQLSRPEAVTQAPRKPSWDACGQESHLTEGTEVIGTLFFEGPVVIDCHVKAEITGQDKVTIARNGVVIANKISAASVVIGGTVMVNTVTGRRIEILATGKARCDLISPILIVHEGAQFEGKVVGECIERSEN
jgi:cytoskeletal protein CcmA (bactofilin family)